MRTANKTKTDKQNRRWFWHSDIGPVRRYDRIRGTGTSDNIYLEDKTGQAQCFVSYNGEIVRCWDSTRTAFANATGSK